MYRTLAVILSLALCGCVAFEPLDAIADVEPEHVFVRPATVSIKMPANMRGRAESALRGSFDASGRVAIRNKQFQTAFRKAFQNRGYSVLEDDAVDYEVTYFWQY